jgi:hypothetical protein
MLCATHQKVTPTNQAGIRPDKPQIGILSPPDCRSRRWDRRHNVMPPIREKARVTAPNPNLDQSEQRGVTLRHAARSVSSMRQVSQEPGRPSPTITYARSASAQRPPPPPGLYGIPLWRYSPMCTTHDLIITVILIVSVLDRRRPSSPDRPDGKR